MHRRRPTGPGSSRKPSSFTIHRCHPTRRGDSGRSPETNPRPLPRKPGDTKGLARLTATRRPGRFPLKPLAPSDRPRFRTLPPPPPAHCPPTSWATGTPATRPLRSQRQPSNGCPPRRPPVGRTRGTILWPSSLSWLELQTSSSPSAAAVAARDPPLIAQQQGLRPPSCLSRRPTQVLARRPRAGPPCRKRGALRAGLPRSGTPRVGASGLPLLPTRRLSPRPTALRPSSSPRVYREQTPGLPAAPMPKPFPGPTVRLGA
jgi:hypothetical protein